MQIKKISVNSNNVVKNINNSQIDNFNALTANREASVDKFYNNSQLSFNGGLQKFVNVFINIPNASGKLHNSPKAPQMIVNTLDGLYNPKATQKLKKAFDRYSDYVLSNNAVDRFLFKFQTKRYLKKHANPNAELGGWPLLHIAITHNCPEVVQALLKHGADKTQRNSLGQTATELIKATYGGPAAEKLLSLFEKQH